MSKIFGGSEENRERTLQSWHTEQQKHGLFPNLLLKPFKSSDLTALISHLRQLKEGKGELRTPLNVGIVGLGRFGRDVIRGLKDKKWINSIQVYSDYLNKNKGSVYETYGDIVGAVETHKNLDSLFDSNPEVLFIATGVRQKKVVPREQEFNDAVPKVNPIFKAAKRNNYQNLMIMGSNPVEHMTKLGHELGICPKKIVGVGVTDSIRLKRKLPSYTRLDARPNDFRILIPGSHTDPVTLFSSGTIRGNPIPNYEAFRDKLTRELKKLGAKIMDGAKITEGYSDAPDAVIEMVDDISRLRENPTSCWTINTETGYATSRPIKIQYYPDVRVEATELPTMDKWETSKLKRSESKSSRSQWTLIGRYLKKVRAKYFDSL